MGSFLARPAVRSVTCLILMGAILAACGKRVRRMDPETTTDLSGYWNDTDSRLVAESMITDCLHHPWIRQHIHGDTGDRPVVIVGVVRNRSMEHVPTGTFIRDLERAMINSGDVRLVASPVERDELRQERIEQQDWASDETRKQLREETGADYMLQGAIDVILDREGGREVKFYQVDLFLTHIESNERVWVGQHKIKKEISRSRFGL